MELLYRGKTIWIDKEDLDLLNAYKWGYDPGHGLLCRMTSIQGKKKRFYLHREIALRAFGDLKGLHVNHINRDILDNRRANLRLLTASQSRMCSRIRSDNASGYRGVSWVPEDNRWVVRIKINGRLTHIGSFTDPIEAAKAWDAKASEVYGEFAALNFP